MTQAMSRMAAMLAERRPTLTVAAGALLFAVLVATAAFSPAHLVYDEPYYLAGARLLVRGMPLREVLLAPLETPAGPLYFVLHWLLAPLTHLDAPAIRWVNLACFAVVAVATERTLRAMGHGDAAARAAMLLAIPMLWVASGMALTEMPAMAFAALATWAVADAVANADRAGRRWRGFALGGIALGIAVLGRQPYLVAAGGFVLIALAERRLRGPALAGLALALAVPLPVFLLWGGLVTPHVARVGGFSLVNGLTALTYLAVIVLLLAPAYFLARWRVTLVIGAVAGLAGVLAGGLPVVVAAGLARRLPPLLAQLFQAGISGPMIGAAACLVVATVLNLVARRADRGFVLLVLVTAATAATAAAVVHQFSSRYLLTALPFALLAVQHYWVPSRWAAARLLLGGAAGYLSLSPYLG